MTHADAHAEHRQGLGMRVTSRLVRLYPASLRDRWGAELQDEASAGGWRRLPDLLAGVVDMWLHPVVWPAASGAQRRHRAAALAFVVGMAGWLLGHLAAEAPLLPATVVNSRTSDAVDVLLLAGLVLVVPLPRLSSAAVLRLAGQVTRRLAVPVLLGGVVVVRANLVGDFSPGLRTPIVAGWWLTLVLGAVQVCQVVAALDPQLVVPPCPLRLRLGIGAVAAAFAFAAAIVLWSALVDGAIGPLAVAVGCALLVPAVMCCGTLRDLSSVAVAGDISG